MKVPSTRKLLPAMLAGLAVLTCTGAGANEHGPELMKREWPFDGPLGKVDKRAAQRGYQIYKEVCSSCHSMNRVSFRNLQAIGFTEDETKTIAAEYKVPDEPNDEGDVLDRAGRPSDKFPAPFANNKAAAAANGGAVPPDLSLMVKARPDGANYIYSLMNGYEEAPKDAKPVPGKYYNKYFSSKWISMPPPLTEGRVTYNDTSVQNTREQMAYDVVNFLQWTAEPEMEERKAIGLRVMLFLTAFTVLFYLAKRRIWARLEH